jgi:cell division septal protein FtsQ
MLSEAERRSLEEIEQRLLADEPRLARTMNRKVRPWLFYSLLLVFGGLTVLLMVISAFGPAFQCLLVTAGVLVLQKYPLRLR